ncbi:hypothetical protein L7F22_060532 [Adiantum nelumboides]|nr:hypothetical protein [Adiantum nelumboides]
MSHRQVERDCSSEPQLEAVRTSSHRHGEQVDSLDAHGESSCMMAEMADLETDDALVVQLFLDACLSEQSSEPVVQDSMMAVTDESVIQTFLDMLGREHVDASSLDGQEMHVADTSCQSDMPIARDIYVDACSIELARSACIASAFGGLMYEMLISRSDIAAAVGAFAISVVSRLVSDADIVHGGAMQVLCRPLHEVCDLSLSRRGQTDAHDHRQPVVTAVDSGQRALEILETLSSVAVEAIKINLIITDYCMPGMTGYDLLKIVKGTYSLKEIPVVILSSENVPNRVKRCLAEGAEDFLFKPLQPADMKRLRGHARPCPSNTSEMPIAKDIYVDACSVELARSASIASIFGGLMYEMLISRPDIPAAMGAFAAGLISHSVIDHGIQHGGVSQVLNIYLQECMSSSRQCVELELALCGFRSGMFVYQ